MAASWTIARIRGVPIELHASLGVGAAGIVFAASGGLSLGASRLGLDPNSVWLSPWALGLALGAGLVASNVIHEAARAGIAIHLGGKVRRVTLTALGGTSSFAGLPNDPWGVTLVNAAGPAALVALGLLCLLGFRSAPLHPADERLLAFHLGQIDLTLALLNLLPAAPLDGGQVLRALLGPRLGEVRATRVTYLLGRLVGIALVVAAFTRASPLLLLVALVLFASASAEPPPPREVPRFGLRVGEVVVPAPRPISPDASLDALERRLRAEGEAALLVVEDGEVIGVVGLQRMLEVLRELRPETRVHEIMAAPLPHITAPMLLEAALRHMRRLRVELLPVIEDGKLVGVVKQQTPRMVEPIAWAPAPRPAPLAAEPGLQPD